MPREGEAALPEGRERVQHMLLAAKDALLFAEGRSRESLDTDRMFARAVPGRGGPRLMPQRVLSTTRPMTSLRATVSFGSGLRATIST